MTTHGRDNGDSEKSVGEVADEIATGVAETIGAMLGVGVSLARLAAKATAPAEREPKAPAAQDPLSEIIQYGVAATANVLQRLPAVGGVAREVARGVVPRRRPKAAAQSAGSPPVRVPAVHAGTSLRIPLSIENPTDQPIADMRFTVKRATYEGSGEGLALTPRAIRFEPAVLTVDPRDFEKLVVFIDVERGTAPGRYVATIGIPNGTFESMLPFDVLPATAPAS